MQLVTKYESREKIPYQVLAKTVFDDIAKEKKRQLGDISGDVGKNGNEINLVKKYFNIIVPFLPLEPVHVQEVINLQFELLQEDGKKKGDWRNLVIDYKVANFYANNSKCIDYQAVERIKADGGSFKKRYAIYGARRISPFFDGPVKILYKRINKVVKDSKTPRRNEVLVISSIDEETFKMINSNNPNVKSDTKKYILMQWCILDTQTADQFASLNKLNQYVNSTRFEKLDLGMQCQNEDNVCNYDEDILTKKDEIDSIFKKIITQSQCITAYIEPLQCV